MLKQRIRILVAQYISISINFNACINKSSNVIIDIGIASATNLLEVQCVNVRLFIHEMVPICSFDLHPSVLLTLVLNYLCLIPAKVLLVVRLLGRLLILHQDLVLL